VRSVALLSLSLLTLACPARDDAKGQATTSERAATPEPIEAPEPPAKEPASKPSKPAAPPLPSGPRVEVANVAPRGGQRTFCFAGPGPLDAEPNRDLSELCKQARGVVRRCEGTRCTSVWQAERWREGLDALIVSLDTDANGTLDERDGVGRLHVAAWSSGAVLATRELPAALASDPRLANAKLQITTMELVAPYLPDTPGEGVVIPPQVEHAFIYRHGKTPADDCSRAYEKGPWLSAAPVCSASTQCFDYDYSYEPALAFVTRRGARSGAEIGHCNIMSAVTKLGLDNLQRGVEAVSEHVPRYADGRAGGRPHDRH
jgi:hypothetical protein